MSKLDLKKNWSIQTTGIFFLSSLALLFLFSDYFLDMAIQNTGVWLVIQNIRWIILLLGFTLLYYFLVKKPYRKFKILEESLSESKKNYRLVVDNLKDDYFFYRHEKEFPFKYLSASVTNVIGFSKTDFIENYIKLGAGQLFENCFERHKQLEYNDLKQPPFELQLKNAIGSDCFLEIKEIAIKDDDGKIIAVEGIARNITRYKRAENELIERENKYHTLFEAANDGFFIMKDDKFIDCNNKILDIFQCKLEDLIMHTPYHYRFSPTSQPDGRSSREKAQERIDLAMEGKPQNFEWVHLRGGSEPFFADINLNKFSFNNDDYLLAVIRDITDKKNAERELLHHEKHFRLIFENSPNGILYFDKDGVVTECNQSVLNLLGLDKDKVLGFNFFTSGRNHELVMEIKKALLGEKIDFKGTYKTIDNREIPVTAKIIPVYDLEQNVTGGFSIIRIV